jgi:hypothetical protein
MTMRRSARDALLRVLIYPIQFEKNPSDAAGRVIRDVIPNNGVSGAAEDYLEAIRSALGGTDRLSALLPQPHSEAVIRAYLARLEGRLSEGRPR